MDHHFSLSDPPGPATSAGTLTAALAAWRWPADSHAIHRNASSKGDGPFGGGAKYHVFSNKNGGVSFYVLTPNGMSVQVS